MSPRAPKKCSVKKCGNPCWSPNSRCEEHRLEAQREQDQRRPTARQRGYDGTWQRFARDYLRVHPVCSVCGAPAQVVDHVDGRGPTGPQGYTPSNLRPACKPCHARFATSFRRPQR